MKIADLRDEIATADAKAAFDLIVEGFSNSGDFSVSAHEQGFLNSLRIKRGDEFCFAAIPNDEWVLGYIRKPELRRGKITPEAFMTAIPEARLTNKGEITLRIPDAKTATRWLETIRAAQQS
ncbi:MAG: hypothetical protein U1E06_07065 [Tabrizicola sp.]|uniref:hypothetical protein n=1 Tax=Tabrizicola sp. TaxID=2005166 RepID=UPI00273514F2|nr:hypothetical protein [Tabrizicola sp.]MDP3263730.1 hypothetical protein [Tabrizicola sp.]MDP3647094.1 hypothetical protein [Paracoccaceae bacterium]MDZ4066600.1 hypothetical protein [Tabrizicola sp.]